MRAKPPGRDAAAERGFDRGYTGAAERGLPIDERIGAKPDGAIAWQRLADARTHAHAELEAGPVIAWVVVREPFVDGRPCLRDLVPSVLQIASAEVAAERGAGA